MNYEEIFSQFYSKKEDPVFFTKYTKDEAYELMREWLHDIVALPHVRKCFSSITLDDEILELTYKLDNPIDDESDELFVKNIFVQGLKICWMEQKIDKNAALELVIGGKEEKSLVNNYNNNVSRLESLERKLRKTIRDYGYYNNDIGDS